MANILLSDITNEAASRTSGIKLKEVLLDKVEKENEIIVDFNGIERYASPFFNNSFAALYIALEPTQSKKIKVMNISDVGRLIFDTSINNAKFLLSNPDYKEKIDLITGQTPKDV